MELWNAWASTTECESEGRHTFYGLQHLAMKSIYEAGEVLIPPPRRAKDKLTIPLQLQVLEADFLDHSRTTLEPVSRAVRSSRASSSTRSVAAPPTGSSTCTLGAAATSSRPAACRRPRCCTCSTPSAAGQTRGVSAGWETRSSPEGSRRIRRRRAREAEGRGLLRGVRHRHHGAPPDRRAEHDQPARRDFEPGMISELPRASRSRSQPADGDVRLVSRCARCAASPRASASRTKT
jgi:hypothetical protein